MKILAATIFIGLGIFRNLVESTPSLSYSSLWGEKGLQEEPGLSTSTHSANSHKDPYALKYPEVFYKEKVQMSKNNVEYKFVPVNWGRDRMKKTKGDSWIIGRYNLGLIATPLYKTDHLPEEPIILQTDVHNHVTLTPITFDDLYSLGVKEPTYVRPPHIKRNPNEVIVSKRRPAPPTPTNQQTSMKHQTSRNQPSRVSLNRCQNSYHTECPESSQYPSHAIIPHESLHIPMHSVYPTSQPAMRPMRRRDMI